MRDIDKKRRGSYEEIIFPKTTNSLESNQYSFMSAIDSPPGSRNSFAFDNVFLAKDKSKSSSSNIENQINDESTYCPLIL